MKRNMINVTPMIPGYEKETAADLIGMYQQGTNPRLDTAIEMMPEINAFLQQRVADSVSMDTTISTLINMMQNVNI